MKKLITIILAVCILLVLTSCHSHSIKAHSPVTYYYLRQEIKYDDPDSLIVPYVADAVGYEGDYQYLVGTYIKGTSDTKLVSPFPAGTTLQELRLESNRVQIVLSPQMAQISGVSLMVAFACLTKTVADMTGIQTVQIRITDNLINGEESITLSPNNFSYWDTATVDS